jgi:hypothetical protein
MDDFGSLPKLRLLALMNKSHGVLRFASDDACNNVLGQLGSFCAEALLRKDRVTEANSYAQLDLSELVVSKPPAKRSVHANNNGLDGTGACGGGTCGGDAPLKKRIVCRCEPFAGSCSQDTRCSSCSSGFCSCCEGYAHQPSPTLASPNDTVILVEAYCSDCLCSLSLTQRDVLQQETEFSMMVGWFGARTKQWDWVPVAVNEFGVFEGIWKWLEHNNRVAADQTLGSFVKQTAQGVIGCLEHNLENHERIAWSSLFKGECSPHDVSVADGNFTRHLWPIILELLPNVLDISIYHLAESNLVDSELSLLERHSSKNENATEHVCLILWNQRVSPHYDLLIPKEQVMLD